ncbi:unnamed protein product [Linum tenue]|uniref:Uncharacterized protein n=1 Tax=Linum tenue TaxID=586396 RepID=A0AAV0LJH9_9ROSI|nr:unnamed protein product [Linum tenue]
MELEISAILGF